MCSIVSWKPQQIFCFRFALYKAGPSLWSIQPEEFEASTIPNNVKHKALHIIHFNLIKFILSKNLIKFKGPQQLFQRHILSCGGLKVGE
jgi:hypothetical protein